MSATGPERTRTDYEALASRYDAGRALPLESIERWRAVLDPYVARAGRPVLDLGSGTGLWSQALTAWFATPIVGVEPSDAMRRVAAAKSYPVWVAFVGGTAEHIPLRAGSCECVWLSTVVHHIPDLRASARELRRVLRGRGPVLVRNSFGDRLDGVTWLRYFPAARRLASKRWPTVAATADAFAAAGFEVEGLHSVPETTAADMRAYYERIRVRANSTLALIDDAHFDEGLAVLERAVEQGASGPVVDHRDLLVLR